MAINLDSTFTIVLLSCGAGVAPLEASRIIIFSACLGRMSGPGNYQWARPYKLARPGLKCPGKKSGPRDQLRNQGELLVDAICPNHTHRHGRPGCSTFRSKGLFEPYRAVLVGASPL
jgi:hypothetical protein